MSHLDLQYIRTEKWKDFACTESLWYTFLYHHKCYLKIVPGEPLIWLLNSINMCVIMLYYIILGRVRARIISV